MDEFLDALKQRENYSRSNVKSMTAAALIFNAQQKRIKERNKMRKTADTTELKTKLHQINQKLENKKHKQNLPEAFLLLDNAAEDAYSDGTNSKNFQKRESQKIFNLVTGHLSKNPDLSNDDLIEKILEDLNKPSFASDEERLNDQRKKVSAIVKMLTSASPQGSEQTVVSDNKPEIIKDTPSAESMLQQNDSTQLRPSEISFKISSSEIAENTVTHEKEEKEAKKKEHPTSSELRSADQDEQKNKKFKKKIKDRMSALDFLQSRIISKQKIFLKVKNLFSGKYSSFTSSESDSGASGKLSENSYLGISNAKSFVSRPLSSRQHDLHPSLSGPNSPVSSWLPMRESRKVVSLSDLQSNLQRINQFGGILNKFAAILIELLVKKSALKPRG